MTLLKVIAPEALPAFRRHAVDAQTLESASAIVQDVKNQGEAALRRHAERLGDVAPGGPLVIERPALDAALAALPADERALLERTAARIRAFAEAQRASLRDVEVPIPGGVAGHTVSPVASAGCYAPGGRFPLPSSVLMTAVTARAAGVQKVWVASPRPAQVTLAAAAVADADVLLAVGGAQAIAAMAYGAGPVPACQAIVGPGNRWVTAAKQLVSGHVTIDMLAGPSELLIIADDSAEPDTIAADLLAQAEHDTDAIPVLITTHAPLIQAVEAALARQLETLPTAQTARAALSNGFALVAPSIDDAIKLSDDVAPEHLQVMTRDAAQVGQRLQQYGGLFVGSGSAEVFGDYGAGPNHTLPTGGTARFCGGLSVLDFLAVRTWMRLDEDAPDLARDAAQLARLEGLEGHARAAERRLKDSPR